MDPAIEASTLVTSDVWALHDLIPTVAVVAEAESGHA